MESPALKIILRAVCLAAQAVQQNLFLVMNDDIIIPQLDHLMRTVWRRRYLNGLLAPIAAQSTGEEAADLLIPTSTAALLFRRRFRLPFSKCS